MEERLTKEIAELRRRAKEFTDSVLHEKDRAGERLWEYEMTESGVQRLRLAVSRLGYRGTALMATRTAVLPSAEHEELTENPDPAIAWARERVAPECKAAQASGNTKESFDALRREAADSLVSQRISDLEDANAMRASRPRC